jgi:steroid delta-isomerase-like uncharacterized protein
MGRMVFEWESVVGAIDLQAVLEQFFDRVLNGGDEAALARFIGETYVEHAAAPGQAPGREGVRQRLAMLRGAFGNLRFTLEDSLADGDKVAARWTMRGVHRGPFMGRPATGQTIEMSGIDIYRFKGSTIVERWQEMDLVGLVGLLVCGGVFICVLGVVGREGEKVT